MAKKKKHSSSKRRGKGNPKILRGVIVMIVLIGGFLLHSYTKDLEREKAEATSIEENELVHPINRTHPPETEDTSHSNKGTTRFPFSTKGLEIPAPFKGKDAIAIKYENFQVLFHTKQLIPLWVAYELTREEVAKKNKKVSRSNNFRPDPRLGDLCATPEDYKGSPYDRGHLAPAGDMSFSQKAMDECFFLTNIAPQNRNLNQKTWRYLEEDIRSWAKREGNLYITTGVVAPQKAKKIGGHKVSVPEYFYKVILSVRDNRPKAIGFVFKNKECRDKYFDHAVSVDSVEILTGLDFFPSLPDSIEERVENTFDVPLWK